MEDKCCVNQDNVDIVIKKLPVADDIVAISEIFKLLGDPSRMRILSALRVKELCVGDLATLMEISQSGVSHQLRLLKQNRIVKTRRDGKMVYYTLDDEHIDLIIDIALKHIHH
jgi:ArsR family transcriptional regulator